MINKFLTLALLFVTLNSFSQENWETTVKAGINCSFPGKGASYSGSQIYFGALGGLEQTYYFDNSIFSVQSGLEYDYIGVASVIVGNGNTGNGTLSRSNANYLSVPLHLKCLISQRWGALAGASYRFGISDRQSGSSTVTDDISLDAGFFYKMKNIRFNLVYQHGLNEPNSGSQMIQLKNRTISFSVSTPVWKN